MNPESVVSPSLPLAEPSASESSRLVRRAASVVLGSLLVAVCAHVAVPLWFTPVPVTLQTFAVLFLGLILGPGVAASAMILYLFEGMAGLPMFSPVGPSGFLHILGPTGGYLLAYPAAAALAGLLRRRMGRGGFAPSLIAAAVASVLILLSGALWFGLYSHNAPSAVVTLAVAPFLPGDILKIIAAAGAATGLRRFKRR
ncbi:MAG TPA: biotin transporter BioY [Acidobacteriaceae bacterium]|jgi:biotin transport system substrate-specific component|nr:biotin transporter BioY [Acidobacteriaceae bacterium]